MFEIILEKYKRCMRTKLTVKAWIQLIVLIIGFIGTLVTTLFKSIKFIIIVEVLLIGTLLFIFILSRAKQNKKVKEPLDESFKKHIDAFNQFLKDNGLDGREEKDKLRKMCVEKLSMKPSYKDRVVPIMNVLILPVIILFAQKMLDGELSSNNISLLMVLIFVTVVLYISFQTLDDTIAQILYQKYYYVERLKNDLDISELFSKN